jgi:hypothetical protein
VLRKLRTHGVYVKLINAQTTDTEGHFTLQLNGGEPYSQEVKDLVAQLIAASEELLKDEFKKDGSEMSDLEPTIVENGIVPTGKAILNRLQHHRNSKRN